MVLIGNYYRKMNHSLPGEIAAGITRRETFTVNIGGLHLGSSFPIRIQSMTNTPLNDTFSSVSQCIKIIKAGADYIRFAVPAINDVKNISIIKKELIKQGFNIPLIADVHFNPEIAFLAADVVEKVRINPGNFGIPSNRLTSGGKKNTFSEEKENALKLFRLLIRKCKENSVALRIGVNHGSLSDRIMHLYGNTPLGMAQSALEFISVCKEENFSHIVISMKSSNIKLMVQSTRIIAKGMNEHILFSPRFYKV